MPGYGMLESQHRGIVDAPARRIRARLRVEAFDGAPQHHLHMPLGLHVATHHAEGHDRFSRARHEGGDDAVHRTFAASHLVRVAGGVDKAEAAVVQRDTRPGYDEARAKALVVGLDERDHAPLRIGGAQVDGATRGRRAGRVGSCPRGVDQLGAFFRVGGVEQRFGAQAHVVWIGNVRVKVGERDPHRFDLEVHALGGAGLRLLIGQMRNDIQRE